MTPEEIARQQIDAMLIASGRVVQDYKALNLPFSRCTRLHQFILQRAFAGG